MKIELVSFSIYGLPVGKGRPRFFRRGKFTGTYTPKKTKSYENNVLAQAVAYKPIQPWNMPLSVELQFFFPVPASYSKSFKEHSEGAPFDKKPDIDNLIKSVLDPLNTVFWEDDKQIFRCLATKCYSSKPRVDVMISIYNKRGGRDERD